MSTPKTFEVAIAQAIRRAALMGDRQAAESPEMVAEAFTEPTVGNYLLRQLWESNEDLRARVAELERRERERKDDGR